MQLTGIRLYLSSELYVERSNPYWCANFWVSYTRIVGVGSQPLMIPVGGFREHTQFTHHDPIRRHEHR